MKDNVGKLDINKLVNLPTSSNNLKTSCVIYFNSNQYNTDKKYFEKKLKMLRTKYEVFCNLVTTSILNTALGEVENKTAVVSNLGVSNVFDTNMKEVENKFPVVSYLDKKMDYGTKISELKGKYITTSDYDNFASDIIDAKVKQIELVH